MILIVPIPLLDCLNYNDQHYEQTFADGVTSVQSTGCCVGDGKMPCGSLII